ncbi:MAG: hypothetical protein ACK5HL_04340 [Bacilli bacterium]
MKKIVILLLVCSTLFLYGCSSETKESVINKIEDNLINSKGYIVEGTLEIINNEDTYKYDIEAAYKKGDLFKVDLKNLANDHKQVILKNEEGVYVVTRKSLTYSRG